MGNKVPELKKENKYVKGTTHFQIQLCGWEFKIAAPSFVGLAMTVQVIIISYGIEAYGGHCEETSDEAISSAECDFGIKLATLYRKFGKRRQLSNRTSQFLRRRN